MPHLGGETLANQLLSLFPALKILFICGYNECTFVHQEMLEFQATFLQKPFMPEQLAYQVRELLD